MQPQFPGFPRRGIPVRKEKLPPRREPPPPFLGTKMGRRLLMYAIGFVALIGTMVSSFGGRRSQAVAPDSAASRLAIVALTTPPRAFASPEVLHQLRGISDFTFQPHPGAINAALEWITDASRAESRAAGPEAPAAKLDFTELEPDEAIAHPEQFRGGLVRARGPLMRVETLGPHPAVKAEYTYRGYLLCPMGRAQVIVTFETASSPAEFNRGEDLEVDGIFLQIAQYEGKDGTERVSPFLVTTGARRVVATETLSFFQHRFYLIIVVIIIVVLAATYFLFRKSRLPAPPTRHVVRPPGPGR